MLIAYGYQTIQLCPHKSRLLNWSDALDHGNPTAVLVLDVSTTFAHVWHAGLLKRVHVVGVGNALLELLRDYLQTQELKVLGVTFESKLTHQAHIFQPAGSAAGKLACLRRMSGGWQELLYKVKIHSSLKFFCLA
ncbi:hypothetical protein E2C01_024774 [Portunus trituberculatus]|uniref:Uncharacterized protein n=1 Tax=Portunus trituberculatus TaxID=210409 RepID=A0A5B7EG27_PORTR|nr:hypothetical protein [Portunus trituberculatus]